MRSTISAFIRKVLKGILIGSRDKVYRTAVAAIPTFRATAGNELLPTER
jgi:hypothetical protein